MIIIKKYSAIILTNYLFTQIDSCSTIINYKRNIKTVYIIQNIKHYWSKPLEPNHLSLFILCPSIL